MKRKLNMSTLLTVLAALFIGALVTIYSQTKTPKTDEEIATPAHEGGLNYKQKEHSRLYRQYGKGKTIRELIAQESKANPRKEIEMIIFPGTPFGTLEGQYKSTYDLLTETVADSDAVLIGTAKKKNSQASEDESFVFTEYIFQVEEIIKNNSEEPVNIDQLVTVLRPGGKISWNGFTVTATDRSFQRLNLGEKYLLFLKFVPATSAYQSINPDGSFQINNDRVITLNSSVTAKFRNEKDLSSFIRDIYSAVNNSGNKQK